MLFHAQQKYQPIAIAASNFRPKNAESSTASQATGIPGRFFRNATTNDGDASRIADAANVTVLGDSFDIAPGFKEPVP